MGVPPRMAVVELRRDLLDPEPYNISLFRLNFSRLSQQTLKVFHSNGLKVLKVVN